MPVSDFKDNTAWNIETYLIIKQLHKCSKETYQQISNSKHENILHILQKMS